MGAPWDHLGAFWGALGAILGSWGLLGTILGASWTPWGQPGLSLGASWGHTGAIWAHGGATLGRLGAPLAPMWTILGPRLGQHYLHWANVQVLLCRLDLALYLSFSCINIFPPPQIELILGPSSLSPQPKNTIRM